MTVPVPPSPFTALSLTLAAGTQLYRVHSARFRAQEFNPGMGRATRFAFFGDPVVPVLYTSIEEDAALSESILHAVPKSGGAISSADYTGRSMSRLTVTRDLNLASLIGIGERALQVDAGEVCKTGAVDYPNTVAWAAAAHAAGFDGLAYPSSKASGREAHVLFGDRVSESDLELDDAYSWSFDDIDGLARLITLCGGIHVEVRLP